MVLRCGLSRASVQLGDTACAREGGIQFDWLGREAGSMPHDKDAIIRAALDRLTRLVPANAWRDASEPYTALRAECLLLASDPAFVHDLKRYVADRSILRRSITSFFTHIAMAARAKWDDAPPGIRPIVARGWFLGRWLPTFLVIDGP